MAVRYQLVLAPHVSHANQKKQTNQGPTVDARFIDLLGQTTTH